ncbi:hypothetical protein ACET3Z_004925 [Daucus carota]
MRGRLRVVGGDGGENMSWAEVFAEYWSRVAGDGAILVIPQPSTPLVGEIPPYEDERVERIEQIREEREYGGDGHGEADGEGIGAGGAEGKLKSDDDDKVSFQGDSSNLDSTDSEVDMLPKKQKKPRRIPPPNPPYRTRKRG